MIQRKLHVERWLLSAIPALLAVSLMLLANGKWPVDNLSPVKPLLALAAIFYWGLFHPKELPLWFVFMLGAFQDSLTGLPLASTSLLYLLYLAILHSQRKSLLNLGFIAQWFMFSASIAITLLLQWVLMSLLQHHAFDISRLLLSWMLLTLLYPSLHKLFDMVQHWMAKRRWQVRHGR